MALFMSNVEKRRAAVAMANKQDSHKDAKKNAMAAAAAAAVAAAETAAAAPRISSQKQLSLKGQIVIYSIPGCPHCAKAKATLRDKRLPFLDISVDRFPVHVREWLRDRTGKTGVPQIFFNERLVGGNEDLQKLVADEDKFKEMVDYVRENCMPLGDTAPLLPEMDEALDLPAFDDENLRCEPDEYALLIDEMRKDGVVREHRSRRGAGGGRIACITGKKVKDSFTGKDFVDWCADKKMMTRERAIFLGRQIVSRRFGVNVEAEADFRDDINALYKLATSDESRALNASQISECVQRPAGEIADDMRKLTLKLFSDFLSPDGRFVDYKGIGTSKTFETYKRMTLELQRVNLERLSREEKLAFFINIYNALVIHGTVDSGVPSNMWQRYCKCRLADLWKKYKFFASTAYNLGGRVFSLNDIENGILRSNRSSMGTLYMKPFDSTDPRLGVALPECEPRIHFALNCGAKSCPPIKTFSAQDIDKELDLATEAFLENDDALRIEVAEWDDEEEEETNRRKKKKNKANDNKVEDDGGTKEEEKEEEKAKNNGVKENGAADKAEVVQDIENCIETEKEEAEKKETEANGNENGEEEKGDKKKNGGTAKGNAKSKQKEKEEYFPPRPVSTVHLSMLFKWYKVDFGENKEEVLAWIHERLSDKSEKKAQLAEILRRVEEYRDEGSQVVRIKHVKYDWGHNAKRSPDDKMT